MSLRTGPHKTILAAATPATTATALTEYKITGNSLDLFVTTVTGGAGTLTLTAEISPDAGLTYYDVANGDAAWSQTTSIINTAGSYRIPIKGLALAPGENLRLKDT